jgi:hypothetical protein
MNFTGLIARRAKECARWDSLYAHRLFVRRARAGMIVFAGECLFICGNRQLAVRQGGAR